MSHARYRRAVGVKYDPQAGAQAAPSVNVLAEHLQADLVVSLARRFGIPVQEDAALAKGLSQVHLDQEIPPDLFEAVALVLVSLEGLKRRVHS
jgi:flagellar biosynthesis protein